MPDRFQIIQIHEKAAEKDLNIIIELYLQVFDNADIKKFRKKINNKKDLLFILAYVNNEPAGFKIGYAINPKVYYSWTGGVKKNHRRKGIAGTLAASQEKWASSKGYCRLRTKSMNRFKPMMILNLKNGFDIIDTDEDRNGDIEIIFEKKLRQNPEADFLRESP